MSPTQTPSPLPATSPLHITGVATFPAASCSRFYDKRTGEREEATLGETRDTHVCDVNVDSLPASTGE
jgi:hypothetical protein